MAIEKLLSNRDVMAATGLCRSTLWRQVKHGQFPKPIRVSARSVRWLESEIEDWLASRPRNDES